MSNSTLTGLASELKRGKGEVPTLLGLLVPRSPISHAHVVAKAWWRPWRITFSLGIASYLAFLLRNELPQGNDHLISQFRSLLSENRQKNASSSAAQTN